MDTVYIKNKKLAAEVAIASVETLEKMNALNVQVKALDAQREAIANERAILRAYLNWEDDVEQWDFMLKKVQNKSELIQKIEEVIFPDDKAKRTS
jgi:hypothetical protein